jgi:hypothetical protein
MANLLKSIDPELFEGRDVACLETNNYYLYKANDIIVNILGYYSASRLWKYDNN